MRCLVTGGAGFIGSHLVDALIQRGDEVVVFDDFSSGHRENLAHHPERVRIVEGDIRSLPSLREACAGCEVVFHQAALPSVPRSMADPLPTTEVNVTGTVNVLWAAQETGARRVVLASSSSVYGDTVELPKHEKLTLLPKSPYAASKLSGEVYAAAFSRGYGLETVALRYFNVFGPRQDPMSPYAAVVPIWLRMMRDGRPPTLFDPGTQSRDFTYVQNVVQANLRASEADASGMTFNVAAGERVLLTELATELMAAYGFTGTIGRAPARAGDIEHSWADVSSAREVLGYEPAVSWREGLQRTVDWFRS